MRLWHIVRNRLRSIVFRGRRESDLSEELQYHLEREKTPFAAWISMGRGGPVPALPLPVLDVYGEKDNPAVWTMRLTDHNGAVEIEKPDLEG